MPRRALAIALLCILPSCGRAPDPALPSSPPRTISYNRDIRPILADRCFRCHGPDSASRKRGLRLDTFEGATVTLPSKRRAIVPSDPDASELVARILSTDPDTVMPPPEMNPPRPLSDHDKQALIDWVKSGATYEPHWAFVAPRAPQIQLKPSEKTRIDHLVRDRLAQEHLVPAPPADRPTLLRRVSFALTGLPPTPEETAAFIADTSANAYEKQVDRLLASPRYGERMAADWLDVARFADTYGYQSDWECRVWPWRDWVINAFNANLPYNQFITEQLAGDLLPNATDDQRLATAFNRLHRQTNEGGSIDEEFRQEYVADRIHTYGTAFLGLTLECARCHDHKYDPISQADYYSIGAFFSGIDETGTYAYSTGATPRPAMRLATADQKRQLAQFTQAEIAAKQELDRVVESKRDAFTQWLKQHPEPTVAPPAKRYPLAGAVERPGGTATLLDGDTGPSFDDAPAFRRSDPRSLAFWMRTPDNKQRATVIHTSRFTLESDQQGYQVMLKDSHLCWEIIHLWPGSAAAVRVTTPFPINQWVHVVVTYDGSSRAAGLHVYLDGAPAPIEITRDHLDGPATVRTFQVGFRDRDIGFKDGAVSDIQVFDRELSAPEADEIIHPGSLSARASSHPASLFDLYARTVDPDTKAQLSKLRDARAATHTLLESIPEMMVMETAPFERESFVLARGQYDQPDRTKPVSANRVVPAVLPFDASLPKNRLGLAQWTSSPANPLTPRVAVNRLWAICFGRGLVPTVENLGLQGEPPANQDLLDALSAEFVAYGWNVKQLLRQIVLSDTFKQSSATTPDLIQRDPKNLLLARGPSQRLTAEMLRDQALAASGLLVERLGGPSVKPWQPPGIWEDAGVSTQGAYAPDTGDNARRRSLYTYRKRTAPPPNMTAFDAESREKCLARRQPTSTPLQPLVIMNDPVFTECARALATRVSSRPTPRDRIALAFQLATSRSPRPAELDALIELFTAEQARLAHDASSATAILAGATGDADLAALALVCTTIFASDASLMSR